MTSDGINSKDWAVVHEYALQVANAASKRDRRGARMATALLLRHLDQLELSYGRLPSILATRADYVGDKCESIRLLHSAWRAARNRSDKCNLTHIASSLAELYIETLRDLRRGRIWVSRLQAALVEHWDEDECRTLGGLRKLMGRLARSDHPRNTPRPVTEREPSLLPTGGARAKGTPATTTTLWPTRPR
jgi:hypothetical protein